MDQETWSAVDRYLCETMVAEDAALTGALRSSIEAGLPAINVAPNQGKLLHLFARMIGAKRILEIGTLGGYSAIWLARALPEDGKLITLEFDPKHASVAKTNIDRAGLSKMVEIRVGPAIETLPTLAGTFDFVFIDANKESTADYFAHAIRLTHSGSIILVDNVVRKGEVTDPASIDTGVIGIRRFNELLKKTRGVTATAIQTVGSKGYDGFTLVRVES